MASIHGSPQHVTVIYQQGQTHLASQSYILSKFPNDHILHHIPNPCLNQLSWWSQTLSLPNPSQTLLKLPEFAIDIWVDTSSSWGIGLYVGGH